MLTDDVTPHILLLGSRRSSKTETLALWYLKQICRWPRMALSCCVAKHSKARKLAEKKIIPKLPMAWLRTYRKRQDEVALLFENGCQIDFLSGKVEDDARGDGVPAVGVDERQIIPTAAVENAMLSCSEGGADFQTVETGTALAGEFQEYWEKAKASEHYRAEVLSISDNVFLPTVFDEQTGRQLPMFIVTRRGMMDPKLFAQEIGDVDADGRYIPRFRSLSGVVYEFFDRARHVRSYAKRRAVLADLYGIDRCSLGVGEDITEEIVASKWKWDSPVIVGLDYNISPMVATVYKVVEGPKGVGDIAWVIDEVILDKMADATRMGIALRQRGYAKSLIVADASDSRARHYKRALAKEGHKVVNPARNNRNPDVKDRVAAMNAVMLNANNETRWFCDPQAARVARAIERQPRDGLGRPAKGEDDHYADSAGYPITKLYPVAIDSHRTVRGRHAA